jgi:hypothetical protein
MGSHDTPEAGSARAKAASLHASSLHAPSLLTSRRQVLLGLGALSVGGMMPCLALAASVENVQGQWGRLEAGTIVTGERLNDEVTRAFPLFNANNVVKDFSATSLGALNDVVLYRIVTSATLPDTGETLDVTGLLALPAGASGTLPVVSWQHGTILSFDQVPSNLTKLADTGYELSDDADSLETLFNVQRFAARGFAVIAADYVGKGPMRGTRGECYGVKHATVATCTSMLSAGLAAMRTLKLTPDRLFLHGWSQGGLNTQWLHQSLRRAGVEITATAAASPFCDLDESWRYWAGRAAFPVPQGMAVYPEQPAWISLCMMVLIGSYERNYAMPGLFEAMVRPEHVAFARRYASDFTLDPSNIKDLPAGSALLVDGFFDRFTHELNSAFLRRLLSNTATGWNYDRPVRFHVGLADEALHPDMVARSLSNGGANAIGVRIANASHRATFLAGLYGDAATLGGFNNACDWFTSLR